MAIIYDGPVAGLPRGGVAYWGFDFLSDALGIPSPMGIDVYINRSAYPLKLRFSFTTPPNQQCGNGCLPRLEFRMGPGWALRYTTFTIVDGIATGEYDIPANYYYGWTIDVQQTTNPMLQVITNKQVSLADAGLPERMDIAAPLSSKTVPCMCNDGQYATCNFGTRYSSGLMGHYSGEGRYYSDDGWNTCPAKEGS